MSSLSAKTPPFPNMRHNHPRFLGGLRRINSHFIRLLPLFRFPPMFSLYFPRAKWTVYFWTFFFYSFGWKRANRSVVVPTTVNQFNPPDTNWPPFFPEFQTINQRPDPEARQEAPGTEVGGSSWWFYKVGSTNSVSKGSFWRMYTCYSKIPTSAINNRYWWTRLIMVVLITIYRK